MYGEIWPVPKSILSLAREDTDSYWASPTGPIQENTVGLEEYNLTVVFQYSIVR